MVAETTDRVLDAIYDAVDSLMRKGLFEELDNLTRTMNHLSLPIDLQLGWLTATAPASSKLPSRAAMYETLAEQHPELCKGLE